MIYALCGFMVGVVVVIAAVLIAMRPAKSESVSYARHEAKSIASNVDELIAIGATPDQLRQAIRSLSEFERVVVCFHDGRQLPADQAELLAAIRAGIARLRERVSTPVVTP